MPFRTPCAVEDNGPTQRVAPRRALSESPHRRAGRPASPPAPTFLKNPSTRSTVPSARAATRVEGEPIGEAVQLERRRRGRPGVGASQSSRSFPTSFFRVHPASVAAEFPPGRSRGLSRGFPLLHRCFSGGSSRFSTRFYGPNGRVFDRVFPEKVNKSQQVSPGSPLILPLFPRSFSRSFHRCFHRCFPAKVRSGNNMAPGSTGFPTGFLPGF
jgi:hypothetical protein